MELLVGNPQDIAAAAPIVASAGVGNVGTAAITAGQVIDAGNAQLRLPVTITFTSSTQYTVSGDPTVYTYAAGSDIDVNGWRVQISGSPAAGDTFTVRNNAGGVGDNRNALLLAGLMTEPVLNGGTTSINAGIGQFVGEVGVKTNQAQITRDAQKIVADEAEGALQAVSGVNLDEEAANLVRYQQAYMAISQMIRVADTIFQSVIDAVRR
jgi:flagellar hook-associated protein 1 FlgK